MATAVIRTTLLLLAVALVSCQAGPNNRPVPSVPQIGADLKCAGGDHAFEDSQAGWGFCYPATWKYNERSQGSQNPPGLDLTFDITDIPCSSPDPSRPSARPSCSPGAGLFAFMIISTYERGDVRTLAAWVEAYMKPAPELLPIFWGNAVEAYRLPDGRRIALTPNHVVILDLHSGQGNLDLEAQMSARLNTWKFTF
ncbi:MAG TPA: hypothetical protein VGK42_11170 [Candidatus Dormibacteraeota bacterium]